MRSFREALWLPGWSEQSIWGYDEQMDTYFAQLWRDGDRNDEPTVWISGCDPIASSIALIQLIASATSATDHVVRQAMLAIPESTTAARDRDVDSADHDE